MNSELDHDLTAWADGTLSREDLITLHGQQGLAVASLHERLVAAVEMPPLDPVAGWALLQRKMDAKVVPIRTGARPRLRRAVLAVAAALLIGGGALAAVRGVAVDPGVVNPPAGGPASQGGTHEGPPGQTGGPAGATDDRSSSHQSSSTSAPTGGTGDPIQGSAGTDGTSTSGSGDGTTGSGDGTSTGDSGGGGTTQDPDGQHPGQGNGGQDNGNDGPHGHGGASSAHA